MIHPMWATFYAAMWPIVYSQSPPPSDGDYKRFLCEICGACAIAADLACAEYEKRDKGSLHRG